VGSRHCDSSKRREPLTQAQNVTFSASKVFEALRDAGFRREVAENCALLGYYTESSSKLLPTFRGNLSAPSLSPYRGFGITCRSHLQVLTEVSRQPVSPVFKSFSRFRDKLSIPSSPIEVSGQTFGPVFKSVPTFQGNLLVPSSSPYRRFGTTIGPVFKSLPTFWDNLSVHSVRNYHYSLRNCPEECSSLVCSCIC
jgi:hypothetical protein